MNKVMIKIEVVENGEIKDYIEREIPPYRIMSYNVIIGVLNDLYTLIKRVFIRYSDRSYILDNLEDVYHNNNLTLPF